MLNFGPEVFLIIPALIIAFSFHEFAHAYVSDRLGDPTPRRLGRLTLNPLAHIDPIGFLMLLVFRFGWAKPVPVNPLNYRRREQGFALVALAGPAMNLALAVLCTILLYLAVIFIRMDALSQFLNIMVTYNVYLAVFNLIPVPPLDGSKLLFLFLPRGVVYRYLELMGQYGTFVLILLISSGMVSQVVGPISGWIVDSLVQVFGAIFSGLM